LIWLIDISNYQGNFNVAEAGREGYSAIICKATEGLTYQDPRFDAFIPQIKAAGLIPGTYHFLRAGDGAAQARAFHARVAAHGGPDGFLCACDNEQDANWAVTKAFFAEWNQLTSGHPLIMYSGAWWWSSRGWNGASLTPYLWHSHYVSGGGAGSALYAKVPESWWTPGYGGWSTATILQFSSSATVAGQQVDVDAFRGTLDELRALTHIASPPTSEDDMTPDQERLLITCERILSCWARGEQPWGIHYSMTDEEHTLPNPLAELQTAVAAIGTPAVSDEQLATLAAGIETRISENLDARIEAAMRRVLGSLDDVTSA
jgi:lysozyme